MSYHFGNQKGSPFHLLMGCCTQTLPGGQDTQSFSLTLKMQPK